MIRPNINIALINSKYQHYEDSVDNDRFIGQLSVIDLSSSEDREGISYSFKFLNNIQVKVGDKLWVEISYKNIQKPTFIILVVSSVNIRAFDSEVIAIDEFTYYSQLAEFIPVEPKDYQKKFIQDKFNLPAGDLTFVAKEISKSLSVDELLGYMQTLLYPRFYFAESAYINANLLKYKEGLFFNKINSTITTSTIGVFNPAQNVKVVDVVNKIKTTYFIRLFAVGLSHYQSNDWNKPNVSVEIIGATPYVDSPVKIVEDINIITDSLQYNNPLTSNRLIRGIFILRDKKTKIETTTYKYAYYDPYGSPTISDTVGDKYAEYYADIFSIKSDSNSPLSDDQKNKILNNKLLAQGFAYNGSVDTFHYPANINDVVSIVFNVNARGVDDNTSDKREDGYFGITSIKRRYSDSGLLMEIKLRQQLKFDFGTTELYQPLNLIS